jgi:superfamily I DNA/RNA helicase
MAAMVTRAGLRDELPAASEADLFAVFYPELCVRAMAADPTFKPFDVLIVDESQDLLRDAYLDVFDRVLDGGLAGGRWRMFFDPRQNLFDGTESEALQRVLRCAPAQFNLSVNCRNTAAVATATGLLADTVCDETLISEGPEVVTLWYSDENEAMDVLRAELRRLTAGGVQARDIVILSARTFEQSGISENLAKEFRISEAPTSQGGIRFATASAFKGLEADAILVIGIDELNTPSTHKSLYVSTSRARVFLSVFLNRRARSEYEDLGRKFGQRLSAGSAGTPGMAAR